MSLPLPTHAAGLGLRRGLIDELLAMPAGAIDFLEVSPDNWIGVGGAHGDALRQLSERHPLTCHGLSLSLGGPDPLDRTLLAQTRAFLDLHQVQLYSEHLSYCAAGGHVYDLLPLPFTAEAVHHVAGRIAQVQDMLGRRIAVENISYYTVAGADMSEIDFINAVLAEADCDLLLDVNNVFVNACNNGYDAFEFLARMPSHRVASLHVAGHFDEDDGFKIDTHGAPVKGVVWALLREAYMRVGVRPTLLERDFNFPPLAGLLAEIAQIRQAQAEARWPEVAHG
ncbi:hypothetical protein B9Y88_04535 [Stenotrophomonas maltophilia]|uniref:HvfB family MNIO-type RiPP peptide maturase n=1 Tax=Stenotrophomonas TaxID=40323 RepID=UPI000C25F7A0|nr:MULTISPECIES: DUF692 domain-containing protein [unclassified Stenotrophomonas]MCU1057520.1 DUF692 domain-containing protein [Stenotrophomonas maltophilia]MDH1243571.1 DUF692 domain-containing protein [Stenotrophomonas sp. GD03948]MDH1577690.1 DUF692 domain-containing protein [Stenotrophomonas sp. GD03744]PJL79509.1 hypothetical protein B9Y88_04535 [Stenotrophomonas maltophilia]PZT38962.1 hypothetical protein A7X94_05775 [Stenotrophomonas maltophilia]